MELPDVVLEFLLSCVLQARDGDRSGAGELACRPAHHRGSEAPRCGSVGVVLEFPGVALDLAVEVVDLVAQSRLSRQRLVQCSPVWV